ncbi:DUF6090 family protein [Ichthyenterobacterium sp. W332]|uniref:DUF6090 family protein n=1 Tax=Microcosmobacter mediterraneus TaxID=3075607 RepID=A0ABU2YN40_9FLAO|nr:DUF6090 family protein [Ichthyenterobacterium sp. W332]MDT0559546.1 DUF6090 family protein [Ichthyenterobacterium sp. W332]
MIKFFRKIRQKMLTENKYSKYLIYAIGEIVLVVIGILIALGINNWNEEGKLNNKRQQYYNQLISDINKDIEITTNIITKFKTHNQQYLDNLNNYTNKDITLSELLNNYRQIKLKAYQIRFNSSTMTSLISSGDIELLEPKLRNKLIDLGRLQELTIKDFDFTNNGASGIVQNISSMIGSVPLQKNLEKHNSLNELRMKNNMSQLVLAYEGAHNWIYLAQKDAIEGLEEMEKELREITEIINLKIKK